MADSDYSYATWVAKGKPGGDFSAWQKSQPGYGGGPKQTWEEYSAQHGSSPAAQKDWAAQNPGASTQVEGANSTGATPNAPSGKGSTSPATFDERLAAGEFKGKEGDAIALEVRRRRALTKPDAPPLPPDLADIALRDVATGRQRRARGGSTSSALGLFNPTASLTGAR